MTEPQHPSPTDQVKDYHLQANEQLTLNLSDATVEVQTDSQGGCTVKVTQEIVRKRSVIWQERTKNLIAKINPIWKKLSYQKEERFTHSLPWVLAALGLILYLSTRLIGLREYPIYFFTDEAVQTLLAEDLVNNDFRDSEDYLLPTFFYNGYQFNLGPSVYLQVIPYMIFGRVLEVNRGTAVLATSLSAIFLFMIGWRIYQMKHPWLMILLLSITPVWFLHSRTSFETGLAFTFYSGFVYYYLSYREGNGKHLYGAVLMAALAFYTYSPVQLVILVNALVFFLVDIRYHLQNKPYLWRACGLLAVLVLPFIRFQIQHPTANMDHLRLLGSLWIQDVSIFEKLGHYFTEYIISFSPGYWFFSHADELSRHQMGPYGFVSTWLLPFVIGGLIFAIKFWKEPRYRSMILVLLMAPMGGALVARGITRILIMLIPMLLFAGLALDWTIAKIQQRFRISNFVISVALFSVLAWFNGYLLYDALTNGPTWDTEYGLSGLQYGAVQITEKIPEFQEKQSKPTALLVTPTWANGTDMVMRFFFGTPLPFAMGNIDTYINNYNLIPDNLVFVMTQEEMDRMEESGKFTDVKVVDNIPYPNGKIGFFFVKLHYIDNIEEIFNEEKAARKILQVEKLAVSGVPAEVFYSMLDMGQITDAFDQDDESIIRTMEANPLEIRIKYSYPIDLASCTARIGGVDSKADLEFYNEAGKMIGQYNVQVEAAPMPRTIDFDIVPEHDVAEVRFLLESTFDIEPAHVHLWELTCSRQTD